MRISTTSAFQSRPVRPNPADTISTGQELGTDDTQKDLFALSAGVASIEMAKPLADFAKQRATSSWQIGAYAIAAGLAGGPALGSAVVEAVEKAVSDPAARGMLAVASGFEGPGSVENIRRASAGLGKSPAQEGLFGLAAGVGGERVADEAIELGLTEGQNDTEAAYYALATAVAGGVRQLGPTLAMAEDFASSPVLNGPYAVAASLAGRDNARSVLRMAESLGRTPEEKAAFSLAGALAGVERAPGFIRMARAMAENETQVPAMTVAATLTGAPTTAKNATAVAGSILFQELSRSSD
jgi:hypothetical protein